jgi:hypothetical protein
MQKLLHGSRQHAAPAAAQIKLLRALGPNGDTMIEFSEADLDALDEARALFARYTQAGASAFTGRAGQPMHRIDALEQAGEETVLVPRNVAG